MTRLPVGTAEKLRRFARRLARRDRLGRFLCELKQFGEPYLFGGAPRDVAFGAARSVHDLDIFVSGTVSRSVLEEFCGSVRKTNFGGYRLNVDGYDVDIWELQRSYAFRGGAVAVSCQNLLRAVCFSTDGVAISLSTRRILVEQSFLESLASRRLSFVNRPAAIEAVVGARIGRLALKLGLELSPDVAAYLDRCADADGWSSVIGAEARWGEHRILTDINLQAIKAFNIDPSSIDAHSSASVTSARH